ncbi:MAG TPA: hypothetical protein VKH64_06165 [Candidatus Binatia bacterium]|nr:hypothetical protein [Candidatus Binatia bacterium]
MEVFFGRKFACMNGSPTRPKDPSLLAAEIVRLTTEEAEALPKNLTRYPGFAFD